MTCTILSNFRCSMLHGNDNIIFMAFLFWIYLIKHSFLSFTVNIFLVSNLRQGGAQRRKMFTLHQNRSWIYRSSLHHGKISPTPSNSQNEWRTNRLFVYSLNFSKWAFVVYLQEHCAGLFTMFIVMRWNTHFLTVAWFLSSPEKMSFFRDGSFSN